MPVTLQEFFAEATRRAAQDLLEAARLLPREKRVWQPLDKGRSALDQIAECALLNQNTAHMISYHCSSILDIAEWMRAKAHLAGSWDQATALLQSSAAEAADAILTVTEDQFAIEIPLPWGPFTVRQALVYPFWNMSYHQGQITYLHSLSE